MIHLARPARVLLRAFLALAALAAALLGGWWLSTGLRLDAALRAARDESARWHDDAAVALLVPVLSARPDDPEALLLAARAARRRGQLDTAVRLLDRLERAAGTDAVLLERVLLRAERGDVTAARGLATAHHAETPLLLDAVARGCLRTYRLAEARAAADQWLGEDPASPQAHFLKGEFDDLLDNHAEAAAAFARCLELDPNRDDARSRLATALVDERRSAEALPHLERLRASRPGDADLAARLGACLAELGRDTDATAALDAALALRPDDALALAERGRLALRAGDPAAAEPRLRQAVRLDPGNVSARYQLVQCLAALGLADEARQQQEQLTQLEADLKRIRELVTTGLATHPNDPALRCEAAGVALRAGLPREGLRWLESALAVDPDYRPAHEALAAYHEMAGNPGLAARHRDRVRRGAGGTAPARGT